ncbi:hypothetical protein AVEN_40731-1 [Araneus ventricosus]|uniref:Uncharacterized protein n=1 Tax=Araneus ventricosus TaxID=182803 RepID=A0A4Y2V1B5_ARAVE|nr:hypothetical protein AVEN_40731-1 [Araneus ventricosus]
MAWYTPLTLHRYNFQPIHLGGSFAQAPCKEHSDPLEQVYLLLLPLSKRTFCSFLFYERASLPLSTAAFGSMTQLFTWITHEDENPNFSTALQRFSSDFSIDVRFRSSALQIAWSGLPVNVQLNTRNAPMSHPRLITTKSEVYPKYSTYNNNS